MTIDINIISDWIDTIANAISIVTAIVATARTARAVTRRIRTRIDRNRRRNRSRRRNRRSRGTGPPARKPSRAPPEGASRPRARIPQGMRAFFFDITTDSRRAGDRRMKTARTRARLERPRCRWT